MKAGHGIRISLAVLLLGTTLPAMAGERGIGVLKVVRGGVELEREGQTQPATVGMAVRVSDQLRTGGDGFVGITFDDNALLSLGAGGALRIDRYDYDSTTHDGAFETTLDRGRLAVVAGKIARRTPDAMRLRTPQSLLGVRSGAEFVVEAGAAP